jgi:hypothetical protein
MKKSNTVEKLGFVLLSLPVAILAYATVIQHWWEWFVVPNGVRPITLVEAIVLQFGARLLVSKRETRDAESEDLSDLVGRIFAWALVVPGLFYLIGLAFKAWLLP